MRYISQKTYFGTYANGADGDTPYIGPNGTWCIGTEDTGVKAKGEDGVSFEGVIEYYIATLATNVDNDKPNPPEWGTDTWHSDPQSTGFGTKDAKGVTYKYLWNVEGVLSSDGKVTYTDVNLLQIYLGGRVPVEYKSYYAGNNTTEIPPLTPSLNNADQNNSLTVPDGTPWVEDITTNQIADQNTYLFEITFVKYAETDENGANLWGQLTLPTIIGRNGLDALTLTLDNDSDVVAKSATGAIVGDLPKITATVTRYGNSIPNSTVELFKVPTEFEGHDGELYTYENNCLTLLKLPSTFSTGAFVFKYQDLQQTFTLRTIVSEVDYNLQIAQTVINNTNAQDNASVAITVQAVDAAGNYTLLSGPTAVADPIKIFIDDVALDIGDDWKVPYTQATVNPIKITIKDNTEENAGFVWDEETIEFVQNGLSAEAYTLSLDNDMDIVAITPSGEVISSLPTITATAFYNAEQIKDNENIIITCEPNTELNPTDWSYSYSNTTGTGTLRINNYTKDSVFTFSLKVQGAVKGQKTFKLKSITSEVDYSLYIEQTTINNTTTTTDTVIPIKVQKKSKDGVVILDASDSDNLKIYQRISDQEDTEITNWNGDIKYKAGSTAITLVLKQQEIEWDIETIEFVQNGLPADAVYTLSLDDDFMSVPSSSTGEISSSFTYEAIKPRVYQGSVEIDENDWFIDSNSAGANDLIVTMVANNITAAWSTNSDGKRVIDLSTMSADRATVTLTLTKKNSAQILSVATFEAIKQKSGADGVYVYVISEPEVYKYIPSVTATPIKFTVYKKVGSNAPEVDTSTNYILGGTYTLNNATPTTTPGTLAKGTFQSGVLSYTVVNYLNQAIDLSTVKELSFTIYQGLTKTSNMIIDKVTIPVVKDGEKGVTTKTDIFNLLDDATQGASKDGIVRFEDDDGVTRVGLNLDVIKAGALSVGPQPTFDANGNVNNENIFYANTLATSDPLNNVYLAGWTVNSSRIKRGSLGAEDSFWMGTADFGDTSTSVADQKKSDWRLTIGSHFGVDKTGAVFANAGKIGAWSIYESGVLGSVSQSGTTYYGIALDPRLNQYDGSLGYSPNVFAIGEFTAGISGTWNNAAFRVKSDGSMFATNANIQGTIVANDGKIGAWYLDNLRLASISPTEWNNTTTKGTVSGLSAGHTAAPPTSASYTAIPSLVTSGGYTATRFFAGAPGWQTNVPTVWDKDNGVPLAKFIVGDDGSMYGTNVKLSGGEIGGWNIRSNMLVSGSENVWLSTENSLVKYTINSLVNNGETSWVRFIAGCTPDQVARHGEAQYYTVAANSWQDYTYTAPAGYIITRVTQVSEENNIILTEPYIQPPGVKTITISLENITDNELTTRINYGIQVEGPFIVLDDGSVYLTAMRAAKGTLGQWEIDANGQIRTSLGRQYLDGIHWYSVSLAPSGIQINGELSDIYSRTAKITWPELIKSVYRNLNKTWPPET